MTLAKPAKRARAIRKPVGAMSPTRSAGVPDRHSVAAAALDNARHAGLLDGDKTEHVSFRAPPALVEAARRATGIESTTELGLAALATLAAPDPVAEFMKRTWGRLAGLPKIEP